MKVTPLYKENRIEINVKEVDELPRGSQWQRTLTIDMPTNKVLHNRKALLKGVSCGLPRCYCDARLVSVK